jgi:hypothetical protein
VDATPSQWINPILTAVPLVPDFLKELVEGYSEMVARAERMAATENYNHAIIELSKSIETGLKELYADLFPKLTPTEKLSVSAIESKLTKKSPLDRFMLGQWVELLKQARLDQLMSEKLDVTGVDVTALDKVKDIRNLATHEDRESSKEEYEEVLSTAKKFLKGTRLVSTFKKPFKPAEREEEDEDAGEDLSETCRKLRHNFSDDPTLSIDDTIENEPGKTYWIQGEWEVVGVTRTKDGVSLTVQESSNTVFHEDVYEETYQKLGELILERLKPFATELKGQSAHISLIDPDGDEISHWEYEL